MPDKEAQPPDEGAIWRIATFARVHVSGGSGRDGARQSGKTVRLALYQPDIPQNTGTMLRLAACLGVTVDIIGPAGFDLSDRALRRAGLDYLPAATLVQHVSFAAFQATRPPGRLLLLTTRGETPHHQFAFRPDDTLLLGRESAGVPPEIHSIADARIAIPIRSGLRSLNVAVAAAIALGEALRQTGGFPPLVGAPTGAT